MILYDKWSIVLVPFPFTDLSQNKKRPALIISPNDYNKYGDVIITYITSNIFVEKILCDTLINNWEDSGLPKPSLIRMKFATINSSIIEKQIGKLDSNSIDSFQKNFIDFFSN